MIGVCPDVAENQCLVSPVLYHNLQQGIDNKNVVIEFDSTGGVAVLSDAVKRFSHCGKMLMVLRVFLT